MMRVASIVRAPLPHPMAHSLHAVSVAQAMADQGHDVTLLVPRGRPPDFVGRLPEPFTFYGVRRVFRIRRIPSVQVRMLHRSFELAAALTARVGNYDICYVNGCARAAFYACRLGLPTVYHAHGYQRTTRGTRLLDRLVRQRCLRRIVANTRALATMIQTRHEPACDVRVVYNGADPAAFGRLDILEARRRLGMEPNGRIACYLGHLYEGRGVEEILQVSIAMPHVRFLIVGGIGPQVQHVRSAWAGRLGRNVTFTGFVTHERVPAYMAAADVLLMPYTTRTLSYGSVDTTAIMNPMKMFEYMAAGRAIVATRLPAILEILDHDLAMLVDPGNAASLQQGIARVLEDDPLRQKLANNARKAAVCRYSWEAHARAILEALP
jgi:glycosyltransferase involved in cell wall biosynthesis